MKILFGVFDWGIGHATRDIPIIEFLLKKKHHVEIISTGRALIVLKKYFGKKCVYHDVPSLHSVYGKRGLFVTRCIVGFPKMLKSLKVARRESEKIIARGFDKVISDARYDVYDRPDNSYFIRHQLRFSAPFGAEKMIEKFLAKKVECYKYVIVPDFPGDKNLTGKLSHGLRFIPKKKIKYIGIISQLKNKKVKEDIDFFVSLSGPEYTKMKLKKKILAQIDALHGKVVIAGGTPEAKLDNVVKNVEFYNFLGRDKQEEMMNRAKFVIIRSGYTTVMELIELDKKALLIPSPGQTEQEYLGDYYNRNGYFHCVCQRKLKLRRDIERAEKVHGFKAPWKSSESVKKFYRLLVA